MIVANVSRSSVEQSDLVAQHDLGNTFLISIVDPGKPHVVPKSNYSGILRLSFHDMDKQIDPSIVLMTVEQGMLIKEFVDRAVLSNANLVVHCTAGVCRSGAIVEVLQLAGWEVAPWSNERHPNNRVKKIMRHVFGLRHSFEE